MNSQLETSESQDEVNSRGNSSISMFKDMMTRKFDQVEKSLKESILVEVNKNNKFLEEKIEEIANTSNSWSKHLKNQANLTPTQAQVVPTSDLRSIMRDQQNEHLAEEHDKKTTRLQHNYARNS